MCEQGQEERGGAAADDPFIRMLKDAARDLGIEITDELFSDDLAAKNKWLRDHGFPALS